MSPWKVAGLLLLIWLTIWFVAKVTVRPAHGHDFYEKFCCSDGDCQLAPPGSIAMTDKGWLVRRGTRNPKGVILQKDVLVPFNDRKVRPLPPDVAPGIHVCSSAGMVYCLYLDAGI
jgi:hypothetical protein